MKYLTLVYIPDNAVSEQIGLVEQVFTEASICAYRVDAESPAIKSGFLAKAVNECFENGRLDYSLRLTRSGGRNDRNEPYPVLIVRDAMRDAAVDAMASFIFKLDATCIEFSVVKSNSVDFKVGTVYPLLSPPNFREPYNKRCLGYYDELVDQLVNLELSNWTPRPESEFATAVAMRQSYRTLFATQDSAPGDSRILCRGLATNLDPIIANVFDGYKLVPLEEHPYVYEFFQQYKKVPLDGDLAYADEETFVRRLSGVLDDVAELNRIENLLGNKTVIVATLQPNATNRGRSWCWWAGILLYGVRIPQGLPVISFDKVYELYNQYTFSLVGNRGRGLWDFSIDREDDPDTDETVYRLCNHGRLDAEGVITTAIPAVGLPVWFTFIGRVGSDGDNLEVSTNHRGGKYGHWIVPKYDSKKLYPDIAGLIVEYPQCEQTNGSPIPTVFLEYPNCVRSLIDVTESDEVEDVRYLLG